MKVSRIYNLIRKSAKGYIIGLNLKLVYKDMSVIIYKCLIYYTVNKTHKTDQYLI